MDTALFLAVFVHKIGKYEATLSIASVFGAWSALQDLHKAKSTRGLLAKKTSGFDLALQEYFTRPKHS